MKKLVFLLGLVVIISLGSCSNNIGSYDEDYDYRIKVEITYEDGSIDTLATGIRVAAGDRCYFTNNVTSASGHLFLSTVVANKDIHIASNVESYRMVEVVRTAMGKKK